MIRVEQVVDLIFRAQIQSDSIPETGMALRCLFHKIPVPSQSLTRLLSEFSLLSAMASLVIFG